MIDQLLSPDYWTLENILYAIDAIIFLLFAIAVGYLLVFAIKSLNKRTNKYPKAKKKYRYAVVFPAYMEDRVIIGSVESFMEQSYPRENYDVFVVSDKMLESTNARLEELGAIVIRKNFQNSTKTKALQESIRYIDTLPNKYDYYTILDADNLVDEYFLDKINDAFYSGCSVVQTHRVAKNYNSNIAILDSVSEEINNSIFRKGHVSMGFSSGLIGSGTAFEYQLFKEYIMKSGNSGTDKQLERFLLKNGYYIEYLPDIYTYDEKVTKSKQFYSQRRRWVSTQVHNLVKGIWGAPMAAFNGNWDYCNKLFQWALPPRIILLGLLTIISVALTIIGTSIAIKWWILLGILFMVFAMAIPDYLFNKHLFKAIIALPILFLIMMVNTILSVFGRRKEDTHTEHFEK